MRKIVCGIIFILLLLSLNISLCIASESYPSLEILPDRFIKPLLQSEPDFSKSNPLEYREKWGRITNGLEKVYKDMWTDFNNYGKSKLPWCVYEAFNELKKQPKITITFTNNGDNILDSLGDEPICSTFGKYYKKKINKRSKREGIWIFGLWSDFYKYGEPKEEEEYCLKAIIFHEMLHFALDIAEKDNFNVRDIENPKGTNNKNFWTDEGVIEDCELRLFTCGSDVYKSAGEAWKKNNARLYNTIEEECLACKLCGSRSNDECTSPPPGSDIPPGHDSPDDWHSFSSGVIGDFNLSPETLIFANGYFKEAKKLLGGLIFDENNSAHQLLKISPVLFLPSGSLNGKENDSVFKAILQDYVSKGGTVIIFSQQYGNQIDSLGLVPEGESIKSYGFREDSSCLKNSVYFSSQDMHPVLSSSTKELWDAGVDGYFSLYNSLNPSKCTVLLQRKINGEPALLYYPYGEGKVILTSLFTDYAASHSMASTAEIKLVRDLLTYAKARSEIPMFNLEEVPNPAISLNVRITNSAETPAAKARIIAYTPDRDAILYENQIVLSLNQNETVDVPVNFTLPELLPAQYGICHTDYELYDAEDNITQLNTESETGMFSVYKITSTTSISDKRYEWITVSSEIVYWGQELECVMHFKNTTDEVKTIEVENPFFKIDHGYMNIPFSSFSVTINPGQTYDYVAYLPTDEFSETSNQKFTFRVQYYDSEGVLQQIGNAKAVFLKNALTKSSITINDTNVIIPGNGISYTIGSTSDSGLSGESDIKLVLEKYNRETSSYTEIKTIFQGSHDFTLDGDFQQAAVYQPETPHPYGSYRLNLEVTSPNDVQEISRTASLYFIPSGFRVYLDSLSLDGAISNLLIPGATYTLPIELHNTLYPDTGYDISNGTCIIRLVSKKSNTEVFRKEIDNISVPSGEIIKLTETFVFNLIETGSYALEYTYKDETREDYLHFIEAGRYTYGAPIDIIPDKTSYEYMETFKILEL